MFHVGKSKVKRLVKMLLSHNILYTKLMMTTNY